MEIYLSTCNKCNWKIATLKQTDVNIKQFQHYTCSDCFDFYYKNFMNEEIYIYKVECLCVCPGADKTGTC
jgi:hypothetical protein